MILFACKQCGQRLARPEAEAGALVFCACGRANRVPWESTVPPEAAPPSLPDQAAARSAGDAEEAAARPAARRWRPVDDWDPASCFNHRDTPSRQTCPDCGVAFCDDCVAVLDGRTLCGPCKNLRVRRLHRPARLSLAALFSLIVAVAGGPLSFCVLMTMAAAAGTPALGLAGLLAPVLAIVLGAIGLRQVEQDPHVTGRALAITGIVAGLVGALMAGIMTILMQSNLT